MELKGRRVDPWGNVILSSEGLVDHLMRGHDLTPDLMADPIPEIQAYNELCQALDHPEDRVHLYNAPTISVEESDKTLYTNWFTPKPYSEMDVKEWLFERCSTESQILRVIEEYALYEERAMIPVLRFLIYAIEDFRKRDVVWGVGRGSSVASYILYLIGVHKVDSIAFDLDPREFLK